MNKTIKTGSCSLVLGNFYYKDFFNNYGNKLLKITKIIKQHNEFRNIKQVKSINNYKKYYSIPEEIKYILNPTHKLYEIIYNLQNKMDDIPNLFDNTALQCNFIDNAGDKDMFETINMLFENDLSFWKSYKVIFNSINQIMKGLYYLHEKKLCHLDIKSENIMVDTISSKFRIIDFGFCSRYPFDNYVTEPVGTPDYFPKKIIRKNTIEWFPVIEANDIIITEGKIPMYDDRNQVYKIDSYCLGRTIQFLKYMYDKKRIYSCWNSENKLVEKIERIKNDLLINNVYERPTITECMQKYNML